ncbi:6-chlorohydroxyquinol-1,2-dioxygenase [Reticulibacter mediterranei]|uniref:6-chlorohydroxyquinol-1,2-dioxygenase n=1 Tax=Reticulibacter mediterranei TaxID=2778369 RepID=A0A8J3N5G0_9CHLR|nr:dioxygenase [Reticulibacter mediterranei]GHO96458.1 6-chlorohydroxyquinol-1,2-dioxygenase [Reticulibacter mediterranei]
MDQNTQKPVSPGTSNLADEDLTQAVLATFEHSQSERFQQVMQSLVRHVHAFAEEVELTEEEWFKGIDFLTRTGHITDDKRQEFVLLSDILGVSMLVIGLNQKKSALATASTVFGPFFVENSPHFENGDDIANGASGEPCFMYGRVLSTKGDLIPGAHIDIWQADDNGFYDVQHKETSHVYGRGHLSSDKEGKYCFWSVRPEAYPIPQDGPVGELLDAANRSPMRPAHVHFLIKVSGYKPLITHVFKQDDPYLDSDAVFGVRTSLITSFERHEPGMAPDGKRMNVPFYTMHYDFLLDPAADEE